MKRVLLYTDTPQTGGAELQMFLLAKFLNKKKFIPILACSRNESLDKWVENWDKENIEVIRLNVNNKHDPRHYTQLKKIIEKKQIDLLHAHIWNPASCRYAYKAAASTKTPLITTEHDPFRLSPLKNLIKKYLIKNTAKIICISENNKKILTALYPDHAKKFRVIHNGIDLTWWQSQTLRFTKEDRKEIKEKTFHAHENTLILITVAELHERKGVKYLIRALPAIVQKFPNIKLVLVGDGDARTSLESLVKKLELERHVTFLGRRKKIPSLLKSSDIFVLPSRREGFGLVNLEAMMIPLPIIATRTGGIPEIVEDDKTGILVDPENTKALEDALLELINNPAKRKKMAEAGHRRVLEKFDARKMTEEYEKVYAGL